ncbi:MAG: translesion error-prone DNA polymerase V autoproteolytic subunit [Bacteroidota bacterium]|jgi:DNA polymerase V|nr:translesion error-prone DNA polymerase V autoproteolytic subunit [Bacteroidota bacterium]NLP19160.1 translesion error-prone DNA polymerase V autoproteolytic subunit [Bacteroidales bacterium]OQC46510.1 MAG: LexA repressor [Bacteroidetes bacterium ADurb.Bin028]HNY43786.1 translesion error-prone DNA polymerase V autoproteolytic subunit [Bacteroidales bacterium]HOE38072.1 translesion error-prone DNA polymerase V autoproteolytic subunit [Bacteroidales bacterium]
MKKVFQTKRFEFYTAGIETKLELAYYGDIRAGFPSPAEDFNDERIDLNKILIQNPLSTFYVKVIGNSMEGDFSDGDLLIIDKSLEWKENRIALCFVEGEFTLKRIRIKNGKHYLVPSNSEFPIIEINEYNNATIWGVVAYSIKNHK